MILHIFIPLELFLDSGGHDNWRQRADRLPCCAAAALLPHLYHAYPHQREQHHQQHEQQQQQVGVAECGRECTVAAAGPGHAQQEAVAGVHQQLRHVSHRLINIFLFATCFYLSGQKEPVCCISLDNHVSPLNGTGTELDMFS